MTTQALRTLMAGMIDYAGLFPPARLSMQAAVEAYARARRGPHEWMLGRFICPASRLDEFDRAAASLMPGTFATSGYREHAASGEPWRISVLLDGGKAAIEKDLDTVSAFNRRHVREDQGLAEADTVEVRVSHPEDLDDLIDIVPEDCFAYVEIPVGRAAPGGDCRGFVAALSGTGMAAKVRTGGVTADAIPSCADLAAFLSACAGADVPFKATAGLHHAVRGAHPLDTTPGASSADVHGFLNVFVGAALAKSCELSIDEISRLLDERSASAFRFTDTYAAWRQDEVPAADLARVREVLAMCFGSCSFDEPAEDLIRLGLIDP